MVAPGLRGANGQPAAMPLSNGPYLMSESITFSQGVSNLNIPGTKYYVSRNAGSSGNGLSWDQAFLTITEAITAVNAAFTAQRQNYAIIIEEGWYAELPQILTASDTLIISTASGNHDSTVLYGVPVAGVFSGVAGGPALTVTGSNVTVANLGAFTSDPLYAGIRNGSNASDGDALNPGASAPTGNSFINCSFVRDTDDGELCGIDDLGGDGTLIDGCFFSTSCKDMGVRSRTNGVTNPVNPIIRNSRFIGCPTGVQQNDGHNIQVLDCDFLSDSSDRPGTMATPIIINGTSGYASGNKALTNKAGIVTGTGTIVDIGNYGTDGLTGQT